MIQYYYFDVFYKQLRKSFTLYSHDYIKEFFNNPSTKLLLKLVTLNRTVNISKSRLTFGQRPFSLTF